MNQVMDVKEGGCLCGAVRYRITGAPAAVVVCHCTHCQRASGSAYSINLLVGASHYVQTGETSCYTDSGDSGLPSYRHFCGKCGSPVRTEAMNLPEMMIVKAGTLDDPAGVMPQMEIYMEHAWGWHSPVATATQFAQAPVI